MKNYLIISLAFFTFNCSSESQKPLSKSSSPAPTMEQVSAIKKSLDYEGEDRWANWDVKYLAEDRVLLYRIALYEMSNEIAMDGYIDLIKDISHKHAPKIDCSIRLLKMGKRVKSKWINAKF